MGCNSSSTGEPAVHPEKQRGSSLNTNSQPQTKLVRGNQEDPKQSSEANQSPSQLSSGSAPPPQRSSASTSTTSTTKTLMQRQTENNRQPKHPSEYNHYSSLPPGLPAPPRHKKYTPFQRPEYFFLESLTQQISKDNAMKEDALSLQLSKLSWSLREAQKQESLSRVSSMDPLSPHSPPRTFVTNHQDAPKLDPFLGFAVATSPAHLSSNEVPIIDPSPHKLSNRSTLVGGDQSNIFSQRNTEDTPTYRDSRHASHQKMIPHTDGFKSYQQAPQTDATNLLGSPSIPGQVVV